MWPFKRGKADPKPQAISALPISPPQAIIRPTSGASAAKHSPAAGTAVIEILDKEGLILALDVVDVEPAPNGAWHVAGSPATLVRTGYRTHQEYSFCLSADHPLDLPQHLLNKKGAVCARVWHSCQIA